MRKTSWAANLTNRKANLTVLKMLSPVHRISYFLDSGYLCSCFLTRAIEKLFGYSAASWKTFNVGFRYSFRKIFPAVQPKGDKVAGFHEDRKKPKVSGVLFFPVLGSERRQHTGNMRSNFYLFPISGFFVTCVLVNITARFQISLQVQGFLPTVATVGTQTGTSFRDR